MSYRSAVLKESESDFSTWVEDMFLTYGWALSHTYEQEHYARRSTKGFYDYVAINIPRLILVEIKSETGVISPVQRYWLNLGAQIEVVEVYLWRPGDREEIEQIILLGHMPNLIERRLFRTTWRGR